MKYTRI